MAQILKTIQCNLYTSNIQRCTILRFIANFTSIAQVMAENTNPHKHCLWPTRNTLSAQTNQFSLQPTVTSTDLFCFLYSSKSISRWPGLVKWVQQKVHYRIWTWLNKHTIPPHCYIYGCPAQWLFLCTIIAVSMCSLRICYVYSLINFGTMIIKGRTALWTVLI